MEIFEYNQDKYNFRKLVENYLGEQKLERIHTKIEKLDLLHKGTDQSTPIHRLFYQGIDRNPQKFNQVYHLFIKEIIKPHFKEKFIVQKYPTFRVHLPRNRAVFEFHTDRQYNHPLGEINFFLAITKCENTNTLWIESKPGLNDFKPVNLEENQYAKLDTINLMHGNQINTTNQTRISMDFRILKISDYCPNFNLVSITAKRKFVLGDYYIDIC